jgi:HEAT repeats
LSRWLNLTAGACVACCWIVNGSGSTALGQGSRLERDVKVTGPRGRTIERKVEIDRGPGYVDRQVQIQRPGGTLSREVRVAGGRPGPAFRPGPGPGFGPRPPVIIERNVYSGPGPGTSFALGMLGGAALTAPFWGPPLVAPPPPVVVPPAPAVVIQQPAVVSAAPAVDPLDPVALAAQRLQSHHPGSRREAAQTLGRLGDPRGIPPLVDVLKNDWFKDVRIAAAQALGQIGGPEAVTVLERAVVYEKKQDVRDAAASALHMAREKQAAARASIPASTVVDSAVSESPRPRTRAKSMAPVPPPPIPGGHQPLQWKAKSNKTDDAPALDEPALDAPADRIPPPPPTPVSPG